MSSSRKKIDDPKNHLQKLLTRGGAYSLVLIKSNEDDTISFSYHAGALESAFEDAAEIFATGLGVISLLQDMDIAEIQDMASEDDLAQMGIYVTEEDGEVNYSKSNSELNLADVKPQGRC